MDAEGDTSVHPRGRHADTGAEADLEALMSELEPFFAEEQARIGGMPEDLTARILHAAELRWPAPAPLASRRRRWPLGTLAASGITALAASFGGAVVALRVVEQGAAPLAAESSVTPAGSAAELAGTDGSAARESASLRGLPHLRSPRTRPVAAPTAGRVAALVPVVRTAAHEATAGGAPAPAPGAAPSSAPADPATSAGPVGALSARATQARARARAERQ